MLRRHLTIAVCALVTILAIGVALLARRSDATTAGADAAATNRPSTEVSAPPSPTGRGATSVGETSAAGPTSTSAAPASAVASVAPVPAAAAPADAGDVDSGSAATGSSGDDMDVATAGAGTAAAADQVAVRAGAETPIAGGPDDECPDTGHGAIVDRATQRAWLCDGGLTVDELPITSAISMPDPGLYPVYAKDLRASSTFGGHFSTMTHFVAFTYGKRTGARIAFHSVPTLSDGSFVQPLESVGELDRRGDSSGCIRVLPDDAITIWAWLSVGDVVHVVS